MRTEARHVLVRGRVQGVGYRHAAREAARVLGLCGWVRNCADGAVEIFVQGPRTATLQFVDWCGRGPPAARVDAVEVVAAAADPALVSFQQRPTA
jgi:acylphosphatase